MNDKLRKSINVWLLCQCYVDDFATELEPYYDILSGWIRSRSVKKLATCSTLCDISIATSHQPFTQLLQIESLFKKNESLDVGIDTEAAARSAFLSAEARCRIANRRLDYYLGTHPDRLSVEMNRVIERVRGYIADTLGPLDNFLRKIPGLVCVSGGATATKSRRWAHPSRKIRRSGVSTYGCYPLCEALYEYSGMPGRYEGRTIEWNRILFVPKNWKTKRTIAGEPDGNMAFQLAFDSYAKDRLTRKGIDLRHQEQNQEEAYVGSLSGNIATVDHEQASDSTALNVVHGLFPVEWAQFLCSLRSSFGRLPDGTEVKYAKFSSMGNGTTFTIETLVFAAICYAVGSKRFKVYGDDVTIESRLVHAYNVVASFLGYRLNLEKTHTKGYYRESCGKHYFKGVDITPFYLRSTVWRKPNLNLLINGMLQRVPSFGLTFRYLLTLVKDAGPIKPYCEDYASGINVTPAFAESAGYIRWTNSIPLIRRLVCIGLPQRVPHQHGAYLLWLLKHAGNTSEEKGGGWGPDEGLQTSELTRATGKYKVRRSIWDDRIKVPDVAFPRLTALEVALSLH